MSSKSQTANQLTFIDRCHFSRTGFARWKVNDQGASYCTCEPAYGPGDGPINQLDGPISQLDGPINQLDGSHRGEHVKARGDLDG